MSQLENTTTYANCSLFRRKLVPARRKALSSAINWFHVQKYLEVIKREKINEGKINLEKRK